MIGLGSTLRVAFRLLMFNVICALGEIAAEYFKLRPQFSICGVPSKPKASLALLTCVFHLVHGAVPYRRERARPLFEWRRAMPR